MTGSSPTRSPLAAGKAEVYQAFGNPVLLRAVERHLPEGGAVLDVGCASGGLLGALAGRAGRREGVEVDAAAAQAARLVADDVHVGSIDDVVLPEDTFDVVVLGDVLEHLVDPAAGIQRVLPALRAGGRVVVSLPNVAHWSVRASLLVGRWEYRSSGILDDTHLRFFTWSTGARLVEDAGLTVVERQPIVSGLGAHLGFRVPAGVERKWQSVGRRIPNLLAFQQLLVARRP